MKLEIPIIVGFDDMESLLDDLKKLQTYKLFEGDEMVLVGIKDVAKVLMDHVKAKEYVKGDDLIRREDALSCFHDWIDSHGDAHTADEMPEYQRIEQLPDAEPKQRYTEEELSVFAHGISLSLLSKRSAQHWRYDEDTATEIKFLERLYEKVVADMGGEQDE